MPAGEVKRSSIMGDVIAALAGNRPGLGARTAKRLNSYERCPKARALWSARAIPISQMQTVGRSYRCTNRTFGLRSYTYCRNGLFACSLGIVAAWSPFQAISVAVVS
jgi:hypothetical protein